MKLTYIKIDKRYEYDINDLKPIWGNGQQNLGDVRIILRCNLT